MSFALSCHLQFTGFSFCSWKCEGVDDKFKGWISVLYSCDEGYCSHWLLVPKCICRIWACKWRAVFPNDLLKLLLVTKGQLCLAFFTWVKPNVATEIINLMLLDAAFVLENSQACIHLENSTLYTLLLNLVCVCSCVFRVGYNTSRLKRIRSVER